MFGFVLVFFVWFYGPHGTAQTSSATSNIDLEIQNYMQILNSSLASDGTIKSADCVEKDCFRKLGRIMTFCDQDAQVRNKWGSPPSCQSQKKQIERHMMRLGDFYVASYPGNLDEAIDGLSAEIKNFEKKPAPPSIHESLMSNLKLNLAAVCGGYQKYVHLCTQIERKQEVEPDKLHYFPEKQAVQPMVENPRSAKDLLVFSKQRKQVEEWEFGRQGANLLSHRLNQAPSLNEFLTQSYGDKKISEYCSMVTERSQESCPAEGAKSSSEDSKESSGMK